MSDLSISTCFLMGKIGSVKIAFAFVLFRFKAWY
mgnify:CR=1 FL=1